jgi:hypothetical protein
MITARKPQGLLLPGSMAIRFVVLITECFWSAAKPGAVVIIPSAYHAAVSMGDMSEALIRDDG